MTDGELIHYGTPRHSGRYPWGSGENPYQRTKSFLSYVSDLRDKGMSDKDIAKAMGMTTKQLTQRYSIAKDEKRMADAAEAWRLKEKGYSNVAIGKRMGMNESSVRSLLKPSIQKRTEMTMATAAMLERQLEKNKYLDVGAGSELYVGVSKDKFETALRYLMDKKGYEVRKIQIDQLGANNKTTIKVLAPKGTSTHEIYLNKDQIGSIAEWSGDGGLTYQSLSNPTSVSSKRIKVRYSEDGGAEKDGLIELRRGVADISLGNSRYAQVRIAVDGTHYLKGMAVYSDNLPDGVDIVFNTNKHKGTPMLGPKDDTVLKPLKDDPDNPFGTSIRIDRQRKYIDKNGKEKLSPINIVNEEGDWEDWKKHIASQVLSKQPEKLAKKQLALGFDTMQEEYDTISSYTNPVIKKKLLLSFADACDSSAVHLEAAALPRQASHVILPITSLKDNEIFAPRYNDGEKVVLIRYPHGGKFEIPELIVNNRNAEAKKIITKSAKDAVGINSKVAGILSGADFDGDTVLVIPNNKGDIKGRNTIRMTSSLENLKNFDPKESYPKYPGMKVISPKYKQKQMGVVSNLITDMTIKGATNDELAAAVRHSMVIIDAEKHELNWKQSAEDNRIAELKKKYQGGANRGASTLISRAKSETHITPRKERGIDKETGEKIYIDAPETYTKKTVNAKGEVKFKTVNKTIESTQMADTKDAFTLSSGYAIENIYAEHANKLKALANKARKDAVNMQLPKRSSSAAETYKNEVAKLNIKLNEALKNAPLERQAQLVANVEVDAKKRANPSMDKDDLKKLKNQALDRARKRVGANKQKVQVVIEPKEWEAIQAGAISPTKVMEILNNANEEHIKELATPRNKVSMTPAKVSRAKMMINAGCTLAEVAQVLGVSVSTVSKALN